MDEAFRGKGKLFERKGIRISSADNPCLVEDAIWLRGGDISKDMRVDETNLTEYHDLPSRKKFIKTLNAFARYHNPAIPKETDFTQTHFRYEYADVVAVPSPELIKPHVCYWCGSEAEAVCPIVSNFVRCTNTECQAEGPTAKTPKEAVAKWNSLGEKMK